jgi:hypothetical protein
MNQTLFYLNKLLYFIIIIKNININIKKK